MEFLLLDADFLIPEKLENAPLKGVISYDAEEVGVAVGVVVELGEGNEYVSLPCSGLLIA